MVRRVDSPQVPTKFKANDASAGRALNQLARQPGQITGEKLTRAIEQGTRDRDNQSAGVEYADFAKFASENKARLTPEAQAVMATYEKTAMAALKKGQTGIADSDFNKMIADMKKLASPPSSDRPPPKKDVLLPPRPLFARDASAKQAVENLAKQPAPISGESMRAAIEKGTADADNQAAGKEFAEFARFAKKNEAKLSPEAKEVMGLYEKYAKAAQGKGQTGIELKDYTKMLSEMRNVRDASAREAVGGLDKRPVPISAEDMKKAIEEGVKDPDGQAAAKEFREFSNWAKQNEAKLTPEAKEVMDIYGKYAKAAQAKGQTGLTQNAMNRMLTEMDNVRDSGARSAVNELNAKPGPISGDDLRSAIDKGTRDLDGQAAGKEYREFAQWAKANEGKLSPEAKQVMALYDKYAKEAQGKGQTGIEQSKFDRMLGEMADVGDVGAKAALAELDQKKGEISDDDLRSAIDKGTKDLDGQAAGKEYAEFAKWAKANQGRLSPEAKEVMGLYDKYAKEAKAKGQTGIEEPKFQKMLSEMANVGDASAKKALAALDKKQGPVTGDDLRAAIDKGTRDLDNQAAGKEYREFAKWAKANEARLSPEAKEVMALYDKVAKEAQAKGQTGIDQSKFNAMLKDMKNVGDVSAKQALAELDKMQPPVSAGDLRAAIDKGTKDLDNQSAGKEYAEFAKWAKANPSKLSPEAKQVMGIYGKYANEARAKGQTGIEESKFQKMLGEMDKVGDASAKKATAALDKKPAPISGDDLRSAIDKGTRDLDNQSAGAEYREFARWAKANEGKLSPEAKEVMATYDKYAKEAQAKGQTGIEQAKFNQMLKEMKAVGDVGARQALTELEKKAAPISGEDFKTAIENGTKDFDNASASREYKEFAKWAKANQDKLSPEAKDVMGLYDKYAKAAQAKGLKGIPEADYKKMLTEMGQVQRYNDAGAGAAIAELNKKTGPVSARDLTNAIEKGTRDADGQAAGTEYADFAKWAAANKEKLSPEAKRVMEIYERHAMQALKQGQTGIQLADYEKMIAEMKTVGLLANQRFFKI